MRCLFLVFVVCSANVSFGDITYVFENATTTIGGGLDGMASGSFTQQGVQMTATSFVTNEASVFNSTNTGGFGINQTGSGDDTDGFDFTGANAGEEAEGLILSFDQNVDLVSIDIGSFNAGNDEITITVGGTTVATITTGGLSSLGDFSVAANTDVEIITTGGVYGNGWSLNSFTVTPEPGSLSLLAVAGVMGLRIRRRRKPLA